MIRRVWPKHSCRLCGRTVADPGAWMHRDRPVEVHRSLAAVARSWPAVASWCGRSGWGFYALRHPHPPRYAPRPLPQSGRGGLELGAPQRLRV